MAVKTVAQGISGTIKWTLDEEGTLFFEPVNGEEGTFADTQNYSREWEPYNKSIKQIKSQGTINLANDSNYMFYHCSSLSNIDALKSWNTQNVTNMYSMFYGCSYLSNIDALKNWNTQNVTSMSAMFYGCSSLTNVAALKNWNTQNVTSMSAMFQGCSSLSNADALKSWNTQNVTSMYNMFQGCSSLMTVGLSAANKKIVSELPSNETSTFSAKWHKEGTTSLYRISWLGEDWDNSYEGTWSREKAQN